jgi:predicted component of type VI protein secretion system
LLADFDPARLQEAFDRQGGTGLLPAKLRYWELYRDKLEAILKDRDGAFRRLFGEEFARAYEDQLRQIKSQSRRGDAGPSIGPDRPDR